MGAERPKRGRRNHGTGAIVERYGSYHGQWRVDGKLVQRKLGPVRKPGSKEGLTKAAAEKALRALMAEQVTTVTGRVTLEDAGGRLIRHLRTKGRKPSTIEGYRSYLEVHLLDYFGEVPVDRITKTEIEKFVEAKLRAGQSVKSVRNYLGLLHTILDFSLRQGWVTTNPCKLVEKPEAPEVDADIRYLDESEINALLRATLDTELGCVDRAIYMTAAMTGLRQGELLALRWMDVDWAAQRIRVRQNYVHGQFGTPKSKRSTRSVPLADALGGELDRLHKMSAYSADSDLVFAHPHTGKPMERSRLLKRYKATLKRAGVRPVRFHDLRHTFGTRMAAAGVAMRTLQEWMGHRDFKTTLIYSDYQPGANEAAVINKAFGSSINSSINLSETEAHSDAPGPVNTGR
jgi:integrase